MHQLEELKWDREDSFYFFIGLVGLPIGLWILSIGSGISTDFLIGIIIVFEIIYVGIVIIGFRIMQKGRKKYIKDQSAKTYDK